MKKIRHKESHTVYSQISKIKSAGDRKQSSYGLRTEKMGSDCSGLVSFGGGKVDENVLPMENSERWEYRPLNPLLRIMQARSNS